MFYFSRHFHEQIRLRNISQEEVEATLNNPDNIIEEADLMVYQKRIFSNNKIYLLRIFVNELKEPGIVVTAYKTSKIKKYQQP